MRSGLATGCALLLALAGNAQAHAEPRTKIALPDGCAFIAHGGKAATPADRCAAMLVALQQSYERSPLKATCDAWPALGDAAVGTAVPDDRLRFIPLRPGRFLMQVLCTHGAYNAKYLFFAYDETQPVAKAWTPDSATLPPLIVFPSHPVFQNDPEMAHWSVAPHEPLVFARAVDARTATITAFAKGIGDGRIGYYTRYRVDRRSFLPTLTLTAVRNDGKAAEGVAFSAHREPRGEGWQRYVRPQPTGCLASLEKPVCP